ncbi:MAG TPA: glycoside hydrolase family 3 N-terminal domain-containing protein [Steroidobacteraceae bacterium]|jgi:beta-glucosidase|nr:glycoside hydrolase family 3 N-terminal domain-containing protein [Steroidobacteraceae bacterium]
MGRIDGLLAAMTLEEKIGQLNMAASSAVVTGPGERRGLDEGIRTGRIGSLLNVWGVEKVRPLQRLALEQSRLGIPLLFGLDVIHGHRTIFPLPLAEACLFDPDTWESTARAAAAEAAQDGVALTFAPMLDVARDPRWGRIVESPGEDPWVAAQFAAAKTRGFQGRDLRAASSLAATAKHLCAYGAVTAGREYASVDVAERTLHEIYLPPFSAAVAAGVAAIMPALTDVAGVPMTANAPLLQGWLRGRLAFNGVLISDYNAIAELCNHGVAKDTAEAAALALEAGIDIDMASGAYLQGLPEALARARITVPQIDASVQRVLRLKERLGLFDDPYRRGDPGQGATQLRPLAREVARRAIVLLTHRRRVLPLSPHARHIALLGPLAEAAGEMLGPWAAAGRAREAVSIREGLAAALPGCRIDCIGDVDAGGQDLQGFAAAIERCRAAELVMLCLGEDASMSGEAASRADLGLPGTQRALAQAALDLGKPVVVLLSSGRPLALPWIFERADAVLATWFLGTEAGHAIADVLTGKHCPSGKLPITWPRHGGQVPIFYGQRSSGRPSKAGERYSSSYLDVPATPQFPFGHGLSYSRFTLHDLRCIPHCVKAGESVEISVSVYNEGPVAGEATLFLFVRDVIASIARPVLELKGVRTTVLAPGERAALKWLLPVERLAFVGPGLDFILEPGRFEIHVGQSAEPAELLSSSIEVLS